MQEERLHTMLRKLLPVGTFLLFVAALVIAPQSVAFADDWKCEAHQYERHAPRGNPHWVPPGHRRGHDRWVPPGHRRDHHRHRDCDDRYERDDDDWYERDRRYRDRRYHDTRDWRYEPRKQKRYDRDREDYGVIIRKGPHGTTFDFEYHKRHR
jgi:hypothetical protein